MQVAALAALLVLLAGCREEAPPRGEEAGGAPGEQVASGPEEVASAPASAASAAPSASAAVVAPPPPVALPLEDLYPKTVPEQRAAMFTRMRAVLGITEAETTRMGVILEENAWAGQGNPDVTEYALTRAQCRERRAAAGVVDAPVAACDAANMVAVPGPDGVAKVCIDRYEFPNVACDYPVTWVSGKMAHELCGAIGKRLCDAHEWEGACAGTVRPLDEEYAFGQPRKQQKHFHNASRDIRWAYGPEKNHGVCATGSHKTDACTTKGIHWKRCGSNTYPAGSFPGCKSPLGVYDQHGNAAEHMNLPLAADQLAGVPDGKLGETEMKGSWFIFARTEAHEDDCRWRAPDWHASKTLGAKSHANYHLGFRCCKEVDSSAPPP